MEGVIITDSECFYYKNDFVHNYINNEHVVLKKNTNKIHLLNEIAFYILNNCNGKKVIDIAKEIHSQIEPPNSVELDIIFDDCGMILLQMEDSELVYKKEDAHGD